MCLISSPIQIFESLVVEQGKEKKKNIFPKLFLLYLKNYFLVIFYVIGKKGGKFKPGGILLNIVCRTIYLFSRSVIRHVARILNYSINEAGCFVSQKSLN
jgi:hypothetical protein